MEHRHMSNRDQVLLNRMEHRHMSNHLYIPGQHQYGNNHSYMEQSRIPIGVAHFVTPVDHPILVEPPSNSRWDLGVRTNDYHSSNISMQAQHIPPPFSRPGPDPYTHTSTNGSTYMAPVGPVGHIHSTHGISSESGGSRKRKVPDVHEGSSGSFYGAGSSSSYQMLYRGSNLSINDQDSMRNVRRRTGPELEPCMTRDPLPNYASRYYHPTTHPANYPVPVHPGNRSTDVTGREWNIAPYAASYNGRVSHPDINDPRRETNQFYAGRSFVDNNTSYHNPFISANLASFSQNPHVPHVQPISDGHNYHHQRETPFYRYGMSNGSSSSNELQFTSENQSTRYSAPGWGGGGYRGVRPRTAVERFQPLVGGMDYHDGFGHEIVTVDEQSSLYHELENFPDPYQDMRLDIDSMSYEELLALEESIGYVSSGLSEDGMSKCLLEKTYDSMDQNHDPCSICLEEYMDGEKIGRIKQCGHEYHVDCIRKWVLINKVCPICKSEC